MNMNRFLQRSFFLAVAALSLAGPSTVRAGTAGIHDNAAFFSDRAKADAAFNIAELQTKQRKDVCLETFKEIPADVLKGANVQDKDAVAKALNVWATQRAKEQSVNGVYILLVKEPARLQVLVGNDTQKQAFTLADRDKLVSLMLAKLRAKDYDGALREGLSFVTATMRSHATGQSRAVSGPVPMGSSHARAPESSGGGGLMTLVIVGLIVWVVVGLIRSFMNRGSQMSSPPPVPGMMGGGMMPGQTGGGGFLRSMLGGMFGAAAGMWMYDQFSGSHGSAYGSTPPDQLGGGGNWDSGYSGQDTDYTSSGGSFGDDSGGGGFDGGGGDFGGGDSGGGDF